MKPDRRIAAIIPALNEEQAIAAVLTDIPEWVTSTIVVDNGSTDHTAEVARACGATVLYEPYRGYGAACLKGIAALESPDIVVFLDADRSDYPQEMGRLVQPILDGVADLVIGSRVLDPASLEPGSLTLPQRFGNALASRLIRWRWHVPCTDLGPFRAIRYTSLLGLNMTDTTYGWTMQMQARAARRGLRMMEVPVRRRQRIGQSKISGTVRGVVGAGTKILLTFACEAVRRRERGLIPDDERLILFTRYPRPGGCNTRLTPAPGLQRTADVHEELTKHSLVEMNRLRLRRAGVATEVRFTGGTEGTVRSRCGSGPFTPQQPEDGDFGTRLNRACDDAFQSGADRVVVIGSDCPSLSAHIMGEAFDALRRYDLVIGPAKDGGYSLIGLRRPALADSNLFRNVDWGTDHVLEQTLEAAARSGLSVHRLPLLDDSDRPDDLHRRRSAAAARNASTPLLSVVIPALNEENWIGATLDSLREVEWLETIVVDGGSADATVDVAHAHGARVIASAAGRAMQMNAGAAAACGDVLLFLHADTLMPEGFADSVLALCADHLISAGAFSLRIDAPGIIYRLIERGVAMRCRWFHWPYGDQAIFMRRSMFEAIGGFRELPVMEDFDIVRRLKRTQGDARIPDGSGKGRVCVLNQHVLTSSRRWRNQGPMRTVLINQIAIAGFLLGLPSGAIARLLRGRTDYLPGEKSHTYQNVKGTEHARIGQ